MQIKTHLASVLFFIMMFVGVTAWKDALFFAVASAATFIPDIDIKFSTLGKKKIFRPIQMFLKHRGAIHSFTFLMILTILSALFIPIIALPLFLGYGLHLFLDSFTVDGIAPLYPSKKRIYGSIKNGGKAERFIFIVFVLFDIAILFIKFLRI